MEIPIASMVPAFADLGVDGYTVDMEFKGTSVYWGIQAGISYEINENISIFAGAIYIIVKNTYTGYIRDIHFITADGSNPRADDFMNGVGDQAQAGAQQLNETGTAMDPLVSSPLGGLSFDDAIAATAGDPATQGLIIALKDGLIDLGTTNAGDITVAQGQGAYYAYSAGYYAQAAELHGGAFLMGDQEGDITQTGNGITPIIGANFSFMQDRLNFGLKYEFQTNMDLTNDVPDGKGFAIGFHDDGSVEYLYANDSTENADLPAMFSIGMDYQLIEPLKLSLTYHTYLDKETGWAHPEDSPKEIDNNFWEFAIGLEYDINEEFLVSTGYLHAETGVNKHYQSNLGFSLTTNTFALGGAWKINDMFKVNLGAYYVVYDKANYTQYEGSGVNTIAYEETYLKSTFTAAIGVDITLGGKK
jgi:long-subunit fatty acid transport protein